MSKKTFVISIFIFFIILFRTEIVSADIGSNAIGSVSPTQSCSGYKWCWSDGIVGIRVTFYEFDGSKIGDSLDFYASNNPVDGRVVYHNTNKLSKIDYINNTSKLKDYNQWISSSLNDLFVGSIDINGLYNSSTTNFFSDKLSIDSLESLKKIFDEYSNEFFGNGKTFQNVFTESLNKYYMIVEPTTVIYNVGGNRYYGTYAELQKIYIDKGAGSKGDYNSFYWISSLFRGNYFHLGKSIYLDEDKEIGGSGTFKNKLSDLRREENDKNLDNKYGIGVLWFGDFSIEENNDPEFSRCDVEFKIEPCLKVEDNGDTYSRVDISYTNCLMDNDSSNYEEYDGATICRIACDERYFISTYGLAKSFTPIKQTDNGYENESLLAGSYFPITGPIVYHKKTCDFESDYSTLERKIQNKINSSASSGGCKRVDVWYTINEETGEKIRHTSTYIDSTCRQKYLDLQDDYINKCNALDSKINNLSETSEANKDKASLATTKLTLNTGINNLNYTLSTKANTVVTEYFTDYDFAYKNTFTYSLEDNINKQINMLTIFDNNKLEELDRFAVDRLREFSSSMATTPINLISGAYKYNVDYRNIFSDTFKSVVRNNGINIDNNLVIAGTTTDSQCPYNVDQRNIEDRNLCDPTKKDCGDPNNTFLIPNLRFVYRPINLNNPFPGYFGIGRNYGYNWTSETVDQYILNNRGSESESLYQEKEPLYVINLDSATIREIREYNEEHAYDDFTLSCSSGEGTECISNFLRGNIFSADNSSFTKNLLSGGTCSDINALGNDFYACADNSPLSE